MLTKAAEQNLLLAMLVGFKTHCWYLCPPCLYAHGVFLSQVREAPIDSNQAHKTKCVLLLFIGKWHGMIINKEHAKVILLINLFKQTRSCMPNICHLVREQFMFFLCGQILFPGDLMLWGRNSICVWLGMILSPGHSARMCLSKQVGNEVGWKHSTVMQRGDINRFIFIILFQNSSKAFFICPNKLVSSHITLHNRRNFNVCNDSL